MGHDNAKARADWYRLALLAGSVLMIAGGLAMHWDEIPAPERAREVLTPSLLGDHVVHAAIGLWLLHLLFAEWRWRVVCGRMGVTLSPWRVRAAALAGSPLEILLPLGIGRELYLAGWTAAIIGRKTRATAALVSACVLDLCAFAIVFAMVFVTLVQAGGLHIGKLETVLLFGGAGIAVVLACSVLFKPAILSILGQAMLPRVSDSARQFAGALAVFRGAPPAFVLAAVLSLADRVALAACAGVFGLLANLDDEYSATVDLGAAYGSELELIERLAPCASEAVTLPAFVSTGEYLWIVIYVPALFFGALMIVRQCLIGQPLARMPGTQISPLWITGPALDRGLRREWRRAIAAVLGCAAAAGLAIGSLTGLAEAYWLASRYVQPSELRVLVWGPVVYGPATAFLGGAIGVLVVYASLFRGRAVSPRWAFGFTAGAAAAFAGVVIGRFRYSRDVLGEQPLNPEQIALLLGISVGLFAVCSVIPVVIARLFKAPVWAGILVSIAVYAGVCGGGGYFSTALLPESDQAQFSSSASRETPNIFLIVADTLRADYLRMYAADAEAQTPNLDEFRKDAILFERMYAQAPWTKPSFGSMFTGRYPTEHGAIGKGSVLNPKVATLAEIVRDSGVYTLGFPNNLNIFPSIGFGRGFVSYDVLEPVLPFGASLSVQPMVLYETLRRVRSKWISPRVDAASIYTAGPEVNDRVIARLEQDRESPIYCFIHYMDTHDPYMSADEPGVGYGLLELGRRIDANRYLESMRRAYIDEIERLDAAFGDLLDYLRAEELYDESIIVFTSDHGEELFDHGGWWHGDTHYEEVLRVPLLIKLPRNVRGGETNHGLAAHIDLAPTLLTLAGIDADAQFSGAALLDAAGADVSYDREWVFAESDFLGAQLESINTGELKLIRANKSNPRGLRPVEFYDLADDPGETRDRAGNNGADIERLRTQIEGMNRELGRESPR